ncbi:peptidoglycan binding protein CsiV [Shewanella algidipiscicola]|uniref:Peptidoglycan-binding protein CsiV n=1 Tax=Shewanella algidipiscicola TaxID=614070 RepID=A0ABQ4PGH6_9GAMM|nr:peptidoglycan binding protein CsiV [Shewanella algidipiscicola]GIU46606.1 hypothetical protein TUM4630_17520 [Shewanella algidipiscicola]
MLKQSLLLVTTLLTLSSSVLAADERWFEVEIYLFERQGTPFEEMVKNPANINKRAPIDMITPLFSTDITGASLGLEGCSAQEWIDDANRCDQQLKSNQVSHPSRIPMTVAASTPQYAKVGQSTVLLAQSQAQFGDIIKKLNRESGHRGLLHMTWQQSMLPRHLATPVRLFAGEDFSGRYDPDGMSISQQITPSEIPEFNFELGLNPTTTPAPLWQLDGKINIYLNHYLYVETALTLREEGTKVLPAQTTDGLPAHNAEAKVPYLFKIWMAQNRRVKSDEIHYFDHPNMGIILQIRKMTHPSEISADTLKQMGVTLDTTSPTPATDSLEQAGNTAHQTLSY